MRTVTSSNEFFASATESTRATTSSTVVALQPPNPAKQASLPEAIQRSIFSSPPVLQSTLAAKILLCGGSSAFPNFARRLYCELRLLLPEVRSNSISSKETFEGTHLPSSNVSGCERSSTAINVGHLHTRQSLIILFSLRIKMSLILLFMNLVVMILVLPLVHNRCSLFVINCLCFIFTGLANQHLPIGRPFRDCVDWRVSLGE